MTAPSSARDARAPLVMVLDPGCDSISGHHFSFDSALRTCCAERGITCRVYGPRGRPAVMQVLEGEAHFRTTLYVAQRSELDVLRIAGTGNQWFFEDLQKLPE